MLIFPFGLKIQWRGKKSCEGMETTTNSFTDGMISVNRLGQDIGALSNSQILFLKYVSVVLHVVSSVGNLSYKVGQASETTAICPPCNEQQSIAISG